jgi:hypothetical protein
MSLIQFTRCLVLWSSLACVGGFAPIHHTRPALIPRLHHKSTLHAFTHTVLFAKKRANPLDDLQDVPDDWNEDELLAELDEVEDEDDAKIAGNAQDAVVMEADEDEEEEEEYDDLDLDEDEEDDYEEIEEGVALVDTNLVFEEDDDVDASEYELIDDGNNPDYTRQLELVQEAIQASQQRAVDEAFDPYKFMLEEMTEQQASMLNKLPFIQRVQAMSKNIELVENDVREMDLEKEVDKVPDLLKDDAYPIYEADENNYLQDTMNLSNDDMVKLDQAYKDIQQTKTESYWDKVLLKDMTGWDNVSNRTLEEMEDCLEEMGGAPYNVTRWLLYDLDFNVTNLILAAVKHNREAPILFQHWYPQLFTYERYQNVRERDFDFSWDDVEQADMTELERYYAGFGYDKIPTKAPAETGIISLEDLDEEEIKMAAFENWVTEVYNPEWDRKDFDDDDMQDEDNVFSDYFEAPQHPDLPTFADAVEDIEGWNEEMGDDPAIQEYRDMMGQVFEYDVVHDEEFQREFRGHLIVACTGEDSDMDTAEKITVRFEKEFGKKVFVETRLMQLARPEDNVFEIWLESYDIDLLHSKKRATSNAKGWDGPAECDDAQIDYLVNRVRFLISDDARYSYRMDMEYAG